MQVSARSAGAHKVPLGIEAELVGDTLRLVGDQLPQSVASSWLVVQNDAQFL